MPGESAGVMPYIYPPALAVLLLPLTHLGYPVARLVWFFLSMAGGLVAASLIERHIACTHPFWPASMAGFLITFYPLRDCAAEGQVNAFVLLLIVGWYLLRRQRKNVWLAGGLLALAINIKMSPAILIVFLCLRRQLREAAITTGLVVLLFIVSVLLTGGHASTFTEVLGGFLPGHQYHQMPAYIDQVGNNSFSAVAYQLTRSGGSHVQLSPMGVVVECVLALPFVAVWCYESWKGASEEVSFSTAILLMLLLPTFLWDHHLVYLMLPFALVVKLILDGQIQRKWVLPLAVAYAVIAQPIHLFFPMSYLLGNVPVLSSLVRFPKVIPLLVVFIILVVEDRRGRTPPEGHSTATTTSA
jgi:hypothetical protein